ncbi:MAG: hypothetical protein LBR53_06535 [Deltaproteobacteria bacterium]|jgi:hypothetical protein|nr:hypothetical protein [Deltaproteobacteria bacterium]
MIGSILTLANNALLYNGTLASLQARRHLEPQGVGAPPPDPVSSGVEPSREENREKSSLINNFELSLAQRLRENAGSGPEAAQKTALLAKEAAERIETVRREKGREEANRLMAQVLTRAGGSDPERITAGTLASLFQPESAAGAAGKKPPKEEVVKKAAEDIERKLERADRVRTEENGAEETVRKPDPALEVETAVKSLSLSGEELRELSAPEFINMVRKVEAEVALKEGPSEEEPPNGGNNRKGAYFSNLPAAAAYRGSFPRAGSLLSVSA